MRIKKLIKCFEFSEPNRSRITLDSDIRLVPEKHYVQLKADPTSGLFPTTADIKVATWTTNPNTVKQWLGFQADIVHPKDDLGNPLTSAGFRLTDGTDEYYWDGAAWTVSTTSWSTEAEIANNIATFPVAAQTIGVLVNLVTTDGTVTPTLYRVKILWGSDIEFKEDLIFRSIVPELRENIRPISDFLIEKAASSTTIDLNTDFPLKTPYDVVEIDSVYDHDGDPNHLTDLFSSYDTGTKVITLTSSVAAGTKVWIKFIYRPDVVVLRKRTYSELAKVPAIVVSDVNEVDSAESVLGGDAVINRSSGAGTRVFAPSQIDIEFQLRCLTDKSRDQTRLNDEIKRHFEQQPLLRSRGLDESYRLWLIDEYDHQGLIGQEEIEVSRIRFRIVKALFYTRGSEDITAVERFVISGPPDLTVS